MTSRSCSRSWPPDSACQSAQIDATMDQALKRLVRYPRDLTKSNRRNRPDLETIRGARTGRRSSPSSCRRRRPQARRPYRPRTASADAFEHPEAGIQADRSHRRSQQDLRRPVIAELLGDRRPVRRRPHAKRRSDRRQRPVADRSHHRHRQKPDHEARHKRRPLRTLRTGTACATCALRLRCIQVSTESPRQEKNCASASSPSPRAARHRRRTSACRSARRRQPARCRAPRCRGTAQPSRTPEQPMRQIGIHQHPEQAEGDDVGDGVRDLAFVGVDRRRGRDNRRDAADARPAAISVPSRGGRPSFRLNHVTKISPVAIAARTTGRPAIPSEHVEHAQPDADEHDADSQDRRGRELESGRSDAGSGRVLRSSRPRTIATAHRRSGCCR